MELGCDPSYDLSTSPKTPFYYAMCKLLLNVNDEYNKYKYTFNWNKNINDDGKNNYTTFYACCVYATQSINNEYLMEMEKHFEIYPFRTCNVYGNYQVFEYFINDLFDEEDIQRLVETRNDKLPLFYACREDELTSAMKIWKLLSDVNIQSTIGYLCISYNKLKLLEYLCL